ncbi:MAG: calcium-binding protein [Cyanobacteria bacterium J06635_10]
MTPTLVSGSTVPLFISDFEGAEFFDTPQEGGGIFAVGQEDQTNILMFGETNDVAAGGDEVDIIMANGGDDNIMGAEGTDFVFAGIGDDIVRGGEGDDVLVGNEGFDVLIGGGGSDIFEFFADQFIEGEIDLILDFEPGEDAVLVVGSTDVSFNANTGLLSVDGLEVVQLDPGLDLDVLTRTNSAVVF